MLLKIADLAEENAETIRGALTFYHYNCDGQNDCGWGCGYRTLQSICSWIIDVKQGSSNASVPSIHQIQEILVDLEDKPRSFLRSKEWIGTCEASMVLSQLFDVDCKLIHIANGTHLSQSVDLLIQHFREFGSPVMMGGDADAASKCILAVRARKELLILDPHYSGSSFTSMNQLRHSDSLRWYTIPDDFLSSSFYNLCLPQLKKTSDVSLSSTD